MASDDSIWFKIGHALERARQTKPTKGTALTPLRERLARRSEEEKRPSRDHDSSSPVDDLLTAGVAMVADRILGHWSKRSDPGVTALLRAAASGAAAALIVDVIRPLLQGDPHLPSLDRETGDRLLTGASQGLLYGAVVEPRIPGPPLARGVLFGSAEYLAEPLGGVTKLLGSSAPQNRFPVVGDVLARLEDHDRAWLEHVAFGIALAVIYESSSSRRGILPDEE